MELFICVSIIITVLSLTAVGVLIALCVDGSCRSMNNENSNVNSNENPNENPNDNSIGNSNGNSNGNSISNSIGNLNDFETRADLIAAVDLILSTNASNRNNTKAYEKYGLIDDCNVSKIQDFSSLFDVRRNPLANGFNKYIGKWDVSSALNMSCMFRGASMFGSDLSQRDVSHIIDASEMFRDAKLFNSDLSK